MTNPRFARYLTASEAGFTLSGATLGCPTAFAIRSERPWSTAAHTDTVNSIRQRGLLAAVQPKKMPKNGRTLPGLDGRVLDTAEVACDVLHIRLALRIVPHLAPQRAGLLEVELRDLRQIAPRAPDEGLMLGHPLRIAHVAVECLRAALVLERLDGALVVGGGALRDEGTGTGALEVVHGDDGRIDGQLLVVHAKTVTVGIWVGEETRLQDRVGRGLDEGDEVRRREGSLFLRSI
jgi:hypothetical protein